MFGNFLYFIIVLLIYLTYQPAEETNFSGLETFTLFIGLIVAFFYFTLFLFRRLEKRIAIGDFSRLDHQFHAILTRQSIMAIFLFAIDIYGLNLSSFLIDIPIFNTIPTLEALLFLGLFVFYLGIVWACAHGAYKKLYRSDVSKQSYVISNITFSIPVLLPWLLLSGFADLIKALPFEWPGRFLETTEGEVTYFLIFLFVVAIIGPTMIQKIWRCKPLESGEHRKRIENLCQKAGLSYADILYWPIFGGKMITAGVMGLLKKFRYILVTPSLLRLLEPEEIDAVIAHEIGHVKRKHLVFYLLFFVGYMLLNYVIADAVQWWLISAKPFYWFLNKTGFNPSTIISALYSLVFILGLIIYFRFIFGFYMRNFERQADIYVYTLFDSAKPLISTLEKIVTTSGQSADRPNWHHFSIKERIDYLKKCEFDIKWIGRHNRKVKKSIGIFFAGMLLVGFIGYQLSFGVIRDRLSQNYIEKVIARELQKSPDNPNLYRLMGDLYYERKDYEGVRDAYEKAIELRLEDPHVLNNLAWFYATCEIESLRNPERSLSLAKLAVEIEPSSHIFDTLAESYFVNGMNQEAIEAAERALKLAKGNRAYYKEQLKKFRSGFKKSSNVP
ncbi:MAG: M48 family metalloprotease [Desulfobacterales bacterium]|nr:M48 family metalloprotease [Desulfobacterales bacterium]